MHGLFISHDKGSGREEKKGVKIQWNKSFLHFSSSQQLYSHLFSAADNIFEFFLVKPSYSMDEKYHTTERKFLHMNSRQSNLLLPFNYKQTSSIYTHTTPVLTVS